MQLVLALILTSSSPIQLHPSPIPPPSPAPSLPHPTTSRQDRSSLVSILQSLGWCRCSPTHGMVTRALPGSYPQRKGPDVGVAQSARASPKRVNVPRRHPPLEAGQCVVCGPVQGFLRRDVSDQAGLTNKVMVAPTSRGKEEQLRYPSSLSASTITFQYANLSRQASNVVEKSAKSFSHPFICFFGSRKKAEPGSYPILN